MTATDPVRSVPREIRAVIHRIERATVDALGHPGPARLLVAVSGGADSSAALIALTERVAQHGWHVEAAHLDHGLASSDVQAGFQTAVAALARTLDLRLHLGSAEIDPRGPGIEAAARAARYAYLAACAQAMRADAVVTGHTANDQVETVLMHLIRGSGLEGLTGMRLRAPLPFDDGDSVGSQPLIRPLLGVTRTETEALCRAFGVAPVEDPANRDPAFFRNRVRRELMPLLRELNPAVDAAVQRLAVSAARDLDALEIVIGQALAVLTDEQGVQPGDVVGHLRRSALRAQPETLRHRVLRAWVERADIPPLSAERTAALDRLAELGGGAVELGAGVRVVAQGDLLMLHGARTAR